MTVSRKPSVTGQAAAARISAGLDAPHEDSAVTRGVYNAPAMDGGDNADQGVVSDEDGVEICVFHRGDSGLYIAKMKLKQPLPFTRQGS